MYASYRGDKAQIMRNLKEAEVTTVFQGGNHVVDHLVMRASASAHMEQVMCLWWSQE